MGDPKKPKKKYATPRQMWQRARVDGEKKLVETYGLKNKREIWKSDSMLRNWAKQAKRLIALTDDQAEKEKKQLLTRLEGLGLIESGVGINAILELGVKDMLDRRLQTVVFKKELAKSIKQARQFVVHRHIVIGKSKMTIPSYMVKKEEEATITFTEHSALDDATHPERIKPEQKKEEEQEKEDGKGTTN